MIQNNQCQTDAQTQILNGTGQMGWAGTQVPQSTQVCPYCGKCPYCGQPQQYLYPTWTCTTNAIPYYLSTVNAGLGAASAQMGYGSGL
jgi:hypothetical protein